MGLCECSKGLQNTGTPSKQRVISSGDKIIAVRMKADDGTANEIDAGDSITQTYLDALINNSDESKRWYPIGTFKSQDDTRTESLSESFTDGSGARTNQGVRSFTGWLPKFSASYIGALESFSCYSFGIYVVDECGGLIGSISSDGTKLRPIRVNEKMWDPTLVKSNPTTVGKVQLAFEFSMTEHDKYLRVISGDEVTADLIGAEGLLPLKATISGEVGTGFEAALKVDFDLFLDASKEVVPGWVLADFAVFNKTTNSAVTITSVTEAPEGTYTFVFPSQASASVLELTNVKTTGQKPGFALKETITVP